MEKPHGTEVLVLKDVSILSHFFYKSTYGLSFVFCTFWISKQDEKSNWTLTHHHKVKFASWCLKLTENTFDMKKTKAYNSSIFQFLFYVLACHFYVLELPLNGRGLADFGEDRTGFKFLLQNLLTMWFLWALVSPSGDENIYLVRL